MQIQMAQRQQGPAPWSRGQAAAHACALPPGARSRRRVRGARSGGVRRTVHLLTRRQIETPTQNVAKGILISCEHIYSPICIASPVLNTDLLWVQTDLQSIPGIGLHIDQSLQGSSISTVLGRIQTSPRQKLMRCRMMPCTNYLCHHLNKDRIISLT